MTISKTLLLTDSRHFATSTTVNLASWLRASFFFSFFFFFFFKGSVAFGENDFRRNQKMEIAV